MSKLSPTQERILKAAVKKPELDIREHMGDIKSPAIKDKVVESMLKNGFIAEGDQDGGIAYLISDAGLEAVGARKRKPKQEAAPAEEARATTTEKPKKSARKAKAEGEIGEPKVSKQQIIIDMLKREEGATLKQMMEATGWQRHSLHGAMAGGLKKKLGLKITSTKESGGETVYKIA